MNKFTQGPWVAQTQEDGTVAIASDEGDIITYAWDASDDVNCFANARLIAKAPELYEAVNDLIEMYQSAIFDHYGDDLGKEDVEEYKRLLKDIDGE